MSLTALPSNGPLTLITSFLSLKEAVILARTCKVMKAHFYSEAFWQDRYVIFHGDLPSPDLSVEEVRGCIERAVQAQRFVKKELPHLVPEEWREYSQFIYVGSSKPVPPLKKELLANIDQLPLLFIQKTFGLPQLAVFHRVDALFEKVVKVCQRFDPDCLIAAHIAVQADQLNYLKGLIDLTAGRSSTMFNGYSLLGRAVKMACEDPHSSLEVVKFLVASLPEEERWDVEKKVSLVRYVSQKNRQDIASILKNRPKLAPSTENFIPDKARRMIQDKEGEIEACKNKEKRSEEVVERAVAERDEAYDEVMRQGYKHRLIVEHNWKVSQWSEQKERHERLTRMLSRAIKRIEQDIKALSSTDYSLKND